LNSEIDPALAPAPDALPLIQQPADTYWHFMPGDRRLRYGDGRRVRVGEVMTVDVPPVLCTSGLHASRRAIDAMHFQVGPWVSLVTLGGWVVHGSNKSVGTERTALWIAPAEIILKHFACDEAEMVLRRFEALGEIIDPVLSNALAVRRAFLDGKVGLLDCLSAHKAVVKYESPGRSALLVRDAVDIAVRCNITSYYAASRTANLNKQAAAFIQCEAGAAIDAYAAEESAVAESNERLTQMLLLARANVQVEFAALNNLLDTGGGDVLR